MSRQAKARDRIHSAFQMAKIRSVKLFRIAGNRQYRQGLRNGVAASVEHAAIPFRDDITTVLDVGASRGQFALFALHRFPNARVISFEPQPDSLRDLKRALGSRVETRPLAVGSSPGSVTMNVSRRDDSSSILEIGSEQRRLFPGTDAVDEIEVEVTTLDAALDGSIDGPSLLKIDVQGLELEVLKGAPSTLRQVDEALIECSFMELYESQALADQVIAHMLDHGLRLAGVFNLASTADGDAIQADFFFRRDRPL